MGTGAGRSTWALGVRILTLRDRDYAPHKSRASPKACSAGLGRVRQGGNEYESCPPAADGSSPAGARNIKLQGTGHRSQLKFLLFPWKEPGAGVGAPRQRTLGPGDSRTGRGLAEGPGLQPWAAEGPRPRGNVQGRPGVGGTALPSQCPERSTMCSCHRPTGTHSPAQPWASPPTPRAPGLAHLSTAHTGTCWAGPEPCHCCPRPGRPHRQAVRDASGRADDHQKRIKPGYRCS